MYFFCEMFNSVSVNRLLINLALIVNHRTQDILLKFVMDGLYVRRQAVEIVTLTYLEPCGNAVMFGSSVEMGR